MSGPCWLLDRSEELTLTHSQSHPRAAGQVGRQALDPARRPLGASRSRSLFEAFV